MLPGGKAIVFTLGTGDIESFDDASIALLSLDTGEYRVLIEGGTNARYVPTGHLVYARAGALLAVPFDLAELRVTGAPVPILEGVVTSPDSGIAYFSVARSGSLVYATGRPMIWENKVWWVDREGRSELLLESPGLESPRLSPDGRFLALEIAGASEGVWLYDIGRSTLTRLASGFDNATPTWAPRGDRIAFRSNREGEFNLFWQAADGSGQAERLTTSEYRQHPTSWSPDGKMLAFHESRPDTGWDLWVLSLDGDGGAEPFLQTESTERFPMFSPNGRWIAYSSDETGRDEIYVRAFPDSRGKQQVSSGGGTHPVWSPNGTELFYRSGDKMMVVDVMAEGEITLGKSRVLFESPWGHGVEQRMWDVAPDGQRFVLIEEKSEPLPTQLILVQNWGEELKQLVPAEN